ncbi:MAG: GFA family protein [Verrucomicrobia bacterium]|nr:GFA family protein [Verrucomicrobiota bacterium]
MNVPIIAGGCLCGAIRYQATGAPFNLTHCHCEDCRKASGAPFVAWASFRRAEFAFLKGQPARIGWATRIRGFCPVCGTTLTFQTSEDADELDITLSSLDAPAAFAPRDHIWVEDQLPWIKLADGLPRYTRQRTRTQ